MHGNVAIRQQGGSGVDAERQRGPARVLVVDDEPGPRQALRIVLKEDYDVWLAEHVDEAQVLLARVPFDVVITDLRMPGRSGIELARHLHECHPTTEIIILTGYGQLETAVAAIDCGVAAYLEKPFDHQELLARVAEALARRRKATQERDLQQLALEANRFETVGRLLSGTVHDLGTPLSVLGSNLDLLLGDPRYEGLRTRLEAMQSQVHHCSELVRSTMNYLRQTTATRSYFTLNGAVSTCLEVAKPLIARTRVKECIDLDPALPPCYGDVTLVRQALLNLITNACQAMAACPPPRQLTVLTWVEGHCACVAVRDSGPGVPAHHRAHVFTPLYSTKQESGTGLGLAVVHHVMEVHEGEAVLDDAPGPGANFILRFPLDTE